MIYLTLPRRKPAGLKAERVKRFAGKTLRVLKQSHRDLSVALTDDRTIRRFNRKYLRHDRPTDVLAFGSAPLPGKLRKRLPLGDIMISIDRARVHARRFKTTWKDELELYIVHGILHLLGYDDHRPGDRMRMQKKERFVLMRVRGAGVRL